MPGSGDVTGSDVPRGDFAIAADGLELQCTTVGSGPAVVLLHAGGEKRSVWQPVAERVAPHGFRVIAMDQRGHGDTGGPTGDSLERYAADLRALLTHVDGTVQLVGASLGGLTSILATADPATLDRVAGLVLVDVIPDPDPVRTRIFLRGLEAGGTAPAPRWDWPLVEDILSRSEHLRRLAATLRVPVTLVRGSASTILEPQTARDFVASTHDGVLREVEGAGHLVAKDRPAALADVLLEHLGRTPRPSP